eukprot:9482611-Pyramimonas_sp.AAC.1
MAQRSYFAQNKCHTGDTCKYARPAPGTKTPERSPGRPRTSSQGSRGRPPSRGSGSRRSPQRGGSRSAGGAHAADVATDANATDLDHSPGGLQTLAVSRE